MYLVDSDRLIDAISGIRSALEVLERLAPDGLAISIVTLGEISEGAYMFLDPERHLPSLRTFVTGYAILLLDEPSVTHFARVRALLRQSGNLIPDMDLLIAATALRYGLILVTRNVRHFQRVPDLRIYQPS